MPELYARGDLDVLDAPVLCDHPCGILVQLFTSGEPREQILDDRMVRMEFDDVAPDKLASFVPEKVQFGLIRPKDGAVGADQVKGHGAVLEELLNLGESPKRRLGNRNAGRTDVIDRFHVQACVLKREGNPNIRDCGALEWRKCAALTSDAAKVWPPGVHSCARRVSHYQ